MWCVYCHQNKINGKKYIGITSRKPESRWGKNGERYGFYFGNAIAKYGWDNFEHFTLYSNLTKDEAIMFECLLIEAFNTKDTEFGYNLTAGGEGTADIAPSTRAKRVALLTGRPVSEETRRKISESNKGKVNSPETRAKISAGNKGKAVSAETRAKISANCGSRRPEVKAKVSAKLKGRTAYNKGKKYTEEEKARLYATRRGRHWKMSDEGRAKISASKRAYYAQKRLASSQEV